MRGFKLGFGFGFTGGGAAGWIGYLMNAFGLSSEGEPTYSSPSALWVNDSDGNLVDLGSVSGVAIGGSRLSFYTEEGATVGADIVVNGDFSAGETGWDTPLDTDIVIAGGVATWSGNGLLKQDTPLEQGSWYEFIWEMDSYTSGAFRTQGFSDTNPLRYDDGRHRDIYYANIASTAFFINGSNTSVGVLKSIEIRKITPAIISTDFRHIGISGDSIAQRQTDALPSTFPTPTTINFSINDSPIKITDNALGNQTFEWVLSTGVPSAIADQSQDILIHCGVNDINDARTWSQVESDLDDIKALITTEHLFISEILPWTNGSDAQNVTVRAWNVNLAAWCASNGATLISTHDVMGKIRVSTGELDDLITIYDSDGVHPSDAGAYKLWSLWFAEINAYYTLPVGRSLQPAVARSDGVNEYTRHPYRINSTSYGLGDKIGATCSDGIERWFECTTAGTSDTSPPVFPADDTATSDGTAAWTGDVTNLHTLSGMLSFPVAINNTTYSTDQTEWTQASITSARDATGIAGFPNTATTLTDASAVDITYVSRSITTAGGTSEVLRIWIKKLASSNSSTIRIRSGLNNYFDAYTGLFVINGHTVVVDETDDWWIVYLYRSGTIPATQTSYIYPAGGDLSGASDVSTTGVIVVGQHEYYIDKTIAEIWRTPPIFTAASAVTRDQTQLTLESADMGLVEDSVFTVEYIPKETGREQGLLYDGTNYLSQNSDNTISFTDGTTTITTTSTIETDVLQTIIVDTESGTISLNGAVEDTDASISVASWASTVRIGDKGSGVSTSNAVLWKVGVIS